MRSRWFGLVVAALAAAVSVWAYPLLPATVATHWNLQGTPDGYSGRLWAVAVMPIVIVGLTGLFRVLPNVDPRRENYTKFLDTYWLIANVVLAFAGVAHALIVANGLGYTVQVDRLLPVGIGLLLAFLGNYLTRVEPNWFVGIRTPWTLSSDTVWRRVHRTGAGSGACACPRGYDRSRSRRRDRLHDQERRTGPRRHADAAAGGRWPHPGRGHHRGVGTHGP